MRGIQLLMIASLLSACAGSFSKNESDLNLSMLRYEKAWRWSNTELIAAFHYPETYSRESLAQHEKIRIASYDAVVSHQREDKSVVQRVAVSYYDKDDIRIKRINFELVWQLDRASGQWLVNSPLPTLE